MSLNIIYRITVRAVYNTGESQDSNPVVASLNSNNSAPTNIHSPLHSNSDSSDEETRHTEEKSFSELSGSLLHPQGQSGDTTDNQDHSREQPHTSTSDAQSEHEVIQTTFASVTQNNGEESTDHIQTDSTHIQTDHVQSDLATHAQPPELEQDQQDVEIEAGSLYHLQRAKHITIDTVSVLSGCTIEYSPPLPQASNSADTLREESSLEFDVHSSNSSGSSSTSTRSGTCNTEGSNEREEAEKSETVTTSNLVETNYTLNPMFSSAESENKGHSSRQGEPCEQKSVDSEEHIRNVPNKHSQLDVGLPTTLSSTCTQENFSSVSHVTTVQATHDFIDEPLRLPIHAMSLPLSKHSLDMSPVSYAGVGHMLSLATILPHEPNSVERTYLDNIPLRNTNNTCTSPPQTRKTLEYLSLQAYNKTDAGSEVEPNHNNVSNSEVITKSTAIVIPEMTVTSVVTPETAPALSLHTSHIVPKQPKTTNAYRVSSDKDIHVGYNIAETQVKERHQNKELGSNYEKPTEASQTENGQEQNLTANQNAAKTSEGPCLQAQHPNCLPISVVFETDQHHAQLTVTQVSKADLIPSKETGGIGPTTSIADKHPLEQEATDHVQKENSSAALASILLSQLETDLSKS